VRPACNVKLDLWSAMTVPSLSQRTFGHLRSGEPVEAWTLSGKGGLVVEIIAYGAIVTRLLAPDRNGRLADVVLGFNDLDSYIADRAYIGAVVGRVAGRITGARFQLEGHVYDLACNDPPNHLHGGQVGFGKKLWRLRPGGDSHRANSLSLVCNSPDGDEGYPGAVEAVLTYTVTDENVLVVQSQAASDRPTPFSLTFHHYFNLAGDAAGSIADHELQIHSDESVLADQHRTLLGRCEPVAGGGNDFREPRRVADALPHLFLSHGDLYRLRPSAPEEAAAQPRAAARLVHPESGRALQLFTTAEYLQFYTGSGLDGALAGKSGVPYGRHAGLCLEPEGYPDGANAPHMGDIILRPGSPRCETAAYAFQHV
jgi:aldose 1-epimerase